MKQTTRLYKLKDTLGDIDSIANWSTGTFTCFSCRQSSHGSKFKSRIGSLCAACVERELLRTMRTVRLDSFTNAEFLTFLGESEHVRLRLVVLWRFHEVLRLVTQKNPSNADTLKSCLIHNLGFAQDPTHPLTLYVQDAAIQACISTGDSLIPRLLEAIKTASGEFRENILVVLRRLAPEHPDVRALDATKNPIVVPENLKPKQTKKQQKTVLKKQKQPETAKQERLEKVLNTLDPSVRNLIHIGTASPKAPEEPAKEKTHTVPPSQPFTLTTTLERRMEEWLSEIYTAATLKKIYACYLHERVFDEADVGVPLNKLRKADLIRAFAKIYANKSLFQEFFTTLPPAIQEIFQLLLWEEEEYDIRQLEKQFNVGILNPSNNYYRGNAQDISGPYLIFSLRSEYNWQGFQNLSYKYYLSIPQKLRRVFKQHLSCPDGYNLATIDDIEKTEYLLTDQDRILHHIKLYYSYISQGNLKFSEKSGKILKNSLTQMTKYCHIDEFYTTKGNALKYIKTRLIIDFLHGKTYDPSLSPEKFLKAIFDDFFQHDHPQSLKLSEYLYHLKGWQNPSGYYRREHSVKKTLLRLLRELPVSQWVSAENIIKYCLYRELYLEIIERGHQSDMYFTQKVEGKYGSNNERIYINKEGYKEAVIVPLLKTMLFLFAVFGIVDVAYERPENKIFHTLDNDYLSPFDSLRYVRLTPLGSYVIGITKHYETEIEEEVANIILDEKRLMITVEGHDPLKAVVIKKIAEPISETCYRVTNRTFLKECVTQHDVKQKIKLFHEHITATPPEIWQDFLESVLEKINPFIRQSNIIVYRLKENNELISLVARDDILKKYILKAEGYHILVESTNLPKIKKRLEEFGYFIDNL